MEAALFLVAFSTEILTGLYLLLKFGTTYGFGYRGEDLIAHLYIPRVVIDNGENSGFTNLGTVWLPIYHILLIPLVVVDPLYTTGFAGTLLNALITACITCLVYRLVRGFGGRWWHGVVASMLFLLSPINLVGNGCSAQMSPIGVLFTLLSAYYFKQYLEGDDLRTFMKCCATVMAGTLSRYEVWPVAILLAIFFTLKELSKKRMHRIVYTNFLFWGMAYWLFYNLAIFRDPLAWIYGPFPGAYGYYAEVVNRILVPPVEHFLKIAISLVLGLTKLMGFIWILFPIALLVHLARRDWSILAVLILVNSCIIIPPAAHGVRLKAHSYSLYPVLPGIVLACFSLLKPLTSLHRDSTSKGKASKHRGIAFYTLFIVILWAIALPLMLSYADPAKQYYSRRYYQWREEIEAIYRVVADDVVDRRSYILATGVASISPSRCLSVFYGISPSMIIDEYDGVLFKNASMEPWRYCEYVVVSKMDPTSKGVRDFLGAENRYYGAHFLYLYYFDHSWREKFLVHYEPILETEHLTLYRRIDVSETRFSKNSSLKLLVAYTCSCTRISCTC